MLGLIAFSKDRPAQLDLLLRSMRRFVDPACPVAIVHTASDELYARGYALVREEHRWVRWVDEAQAGGFKPATLALVAAAGDRVAFLVDDIVFTHELAADAAPLRALDADPSLLCCSLRLDPGKTYCYALDRPMTPPGATTWEWAGREGDWGYPMSLDGHVFRTAEIRPLLERLDYANPNALEAALAAAPLPAPRATCFDVARLVNVPDNRVQDTAANRHAGGSARALAAAFLGGCRLDLSPFEGLRAPSVHHEIALEFAADGPAPRVSVVIPCHDMADTLPEAVGSVRACDLDGDVEIIVVDDGSADESAAVARELGVVVIEQPASGHPAHARNAGFAAARAPYVLALDADDRVQPGFLGATVAALDAHPHAGFAYGDELDFGAGEDVLHVTPAYDFAGLTRANFLGSATLVRRAAWRAAGGYDAGVGYEDWDLWIGLGHAGRHGVKADGAVFEHRVSDTGRWAGDIARDREIKARLVLKRPELYDAAQLAWARSVLAGEATAPDHIGVIPTLMPQPATAPIDARRFAVAALADELFDNPALLHAYGRAFDARDDVTLVIYGDATPEEISTRLAPAIAAAGLEDDDAADLLAVLGGPPQGAAVAARAVALLSERPAPEPFVALPRFDAANVAALREVVSEEAAPAPHTAEQRFHAELAAYRAMPGAEEVHDEDLNPQLNDRLPTSPYDQHYFFQDVWAARRIADLRPRRHVDVGSRVDYVGFLTALTDVVFVDIRPLEAAVEGLSSVAGSILDLPFPDHSVESLSCLHVAEHIGLGRYGDELDPHGTRKAAAELQRVVAPGGQLLFSGPVGRPRTCFNAHRVHDPRVIVEELFGELELVEFSGVDDAGVFRRHRSVDEFAGASYACGMFRFVRPQGGAVPRRRPVASPAVELPATGGAVTTVPGLLAGRLASALGLQRAVETGTYLGSGTRLLASIFGRVTTIELSQELHRRAVETFAAVPHVEALHGDSGALLGSLVDASVPTFWYLDGHWSGDITAGEDDECPLLAELAALEAGHPDDCIVIDDARFFLAAPPPPHRPEQWPTLIEIIGALQRGPAPRHVTLLDDQIVAVPVAARGVVDAYGRDRLTPGG